MTTNGKRKTDCPQRRKISLEAPGDVADSFFVCRPFESQSFDSENWNVSGKKLRTEKTQDRPAEAGADVDRGQKGAYTRQELMQQLQACGCPQIISTLAEYLLVTANLQKDRKRRQEFVLRPRSTHTDLSAWEMLGCK